MLAPVVILLPCSPSGRVRPPPSAKRPPHSPIRWRSTIWQRKASVNSADARRDRVSAPGEGCSADNAEPKSGSLSHGFHPDRFQINAVESGVLEQSQTIAQEQRHDVD